MEQACVRLDRTGVAAWNAALGTNMASKEGVPLNQITVRGFDRELSAILRRLAKRAGLSLNQAARRLPRRGAGLPGGSSREDTVGTSFDHLIGSWTQADADEIDAALEEFETIDAAARR